MGTKNKKSHGKLLAAGVILTISLTESRLVYKIWELTPYARYALCRQKGPFLITVVSFVDMPIHVIGLFLCVTMSDFVIPQLSNTLAFDVLLELILRMILKIHNSAASSFFI